MERLPLALETLCSRTPHPPHRRPLARVTCKPADATKQTWSLPHLIDRVSTHVRSSKGQTYAYPCQFPSPVPPTALVDRITRPRPFIEPGRETEREGISHAGRECSRRLQEITHHVKESKGVAREHRCAARIGIEARTPHKPQRILTPKASDPRLVVPSAVWFPPARFQPVESASAWARRGCSAPARRAGEAFGGEGRRGHLGSA